MKEEESRSDEKPVTRIYAFGFLKLVLGAALWVIFLMALVLPKPWLVPIVLACSCGTIRLWAFPVIVGNEDGANFYTFWGEEDEVGKAAATIHSEAVRVSI